MLVCLFQKVSSIFKQHLKVLVCLRQMIVQLFLPPSKLVKKKAEVLKVTG